jgi:hypothetical protein
VAFSPAGSLVVTTVADEDNSTSNPAVGTGTSLREAIHFADASAGHDDISFDPGVFGTAATITLGGAPLPALSGNTTITGPAAGLTISGNNASRVFRIISGVTVTLDTLTIANGNSTTGGGIENAGSLAVRNATSATLPP